jgi:hypothetical protein
LAIGVITINTIKVIISESRVIIRIKGEHLLYSKISGGMIGYGWRKVMKHLNDNNILVYYQHGFRSGHSCETQLLTTIEDISRTLDMRKQVDMMILDFGYPRVDVDF